MRENHKGPFQELVVFSVAVVSWKKNLIRAWAKSFAPSYWLSMNAV